MLNVFKDALLALMREKSVFIWSLAFPLIPSTMLVFMFANLDEAGQFEPIPTAAVADESCDAALGFPEMIGTLAEPGAGQMLDVARVTTEQKARNLTSGDVAAEAGYFNILGMVISFLGGARISFDLLDPSVQVLARFSPACRYTGALQAAADMGAATRRRRCPFWRTWA